MLELWWKFHPNSDVIYTYIRDINLKQIFCLLVSQEKIYYEDPKKLFYEYFQYVCSLKDNGKATKSGKMEKFLFCDYVIARTNTMAMI